MSLRAKYLGAAGVVIDGSLRDIQEHCDIEFPVSSMQRPRSRLTSRSMSINKRH